MKNFSSSTIYFNSFHEVISLITSEPFVNFKSRSSKRENFTTLHIQRYLEGDFDVTTVNRFENKYD